MTLQGWQHIRRLALFLLVVISLVVLIFGHSHWPSDYFVHESLEALGLILILVCIAGRTWCSLYIGGRKKAELVNVGPYSIMRNPLYTFSFVGAFGVGFQFGAMLTGVFAFLLTYAIFYVLVLREEAYLLEKFGAAYQHYFETVPRFFPKFSLWNSPDTIEVYPKIVIQTFLDALFFLLSVPLLEWVEYAQEDGVIPILFTVF